MKTMAVLGRLSFVAVAVLVLSGAALPSASPRAPVTQSLDLRVPGQPSPVKVGGQWQLSYELHLDNYSGEPLTLKWLRVIDPDTGKALREYESASLRALLSQPGKTGQGDDASAIAPGTHAIVFLQIPLPDVPAADLRLTHEFGIGAPGKAVQSIRGGAVTLHGRAMPVVFSPPLRGGYWVAVYDASWPRGHRRSVYAVNGEAHIPGRFAIDWIKVDQTGHDTKGDATEPANWLGYGEEVLAVADATVAAAMDGMAEPAKVDPGKPTRVPLQDASGNYVSLDLGGGRYVFYEHLKTGSVAVKTGQKVHRGDVIGRLGYSGETTGPHLHMHVADANSPLDAEGIPYALDGFDWLGRYETIDDFAKEKPWQRAALMLPGHSELPAPLSVVAFPPMTHAFDDK